MSEGVGRTTGVEVAAPILTNIGLGSARTTIAIAMVNSVLAAIITAQNMTVVVRAAIIAATPIVAIMVVVATLETISGEATLGTTHLAGGASAVVMAIRIPVVVTDVTGISAAPTGQ